MSHVLFVHIILMKEANDKGIVTVYSQVFFFNYCSQVQQ